MAEQAKKRWKYHFYFICLNKIAAAFTQIDYAGSALPKEEKAETILNRP